MNVILVLLGVCVLFLNLYKWLCIAQKEHYIAGSVSKIWTLWATKRTINTPIAILGIAGLFAVIIDDVAEPIRVSGILISLFAWAIFPFGFKYWDKSMQAKLTRRFLRLSFVSVLVSIGLVVLIASVDGYAAGVMITVLLLNRVVDFAAYIMKPIENLLANKFVKQASQRLKKVSPVVVGITGSFGKTSTKNHLKELIAGSRQVVATPASWNNKGGISRAINENLEDGTEVFIAEMGMYKRGEISALCKWVRPSISVITAIGQAHLERIGSVANIVKAKSEILETADTVVLWVSDENLDKLSTTIEAKRVIRCGYEDKAQLEVKVSKLKDEIVFLDKHKNKIATIPADTALHVSNIACAIGAYIALGLSTSNMQEKVANLSTPEHRASVGKADKGYVVIDNTFNSNLPGAKNNIETLKNEVMTGNSYVVCPGIVELGREQYDSNFNLAKSVIESGSKLIVTHYTNRQALSEGAKSAGGDVSVFNNREEAVEWVRENLQAEDGVLYENDLPLYYP